MAIVSTDISQEEFVEKTKIEGGDGMLYMACINIGQGDCTFIVCPNGKRMMIDAGEMGWDNSSLDKVKAELPYDKESVELPIDVLVITHPDNDHYSEIGELLGGSSIVELYYSTTPLATEWQQYKMIKFKTWQAYKANIGKTVALNVNAAQPAPVDLILDGGKEGGEACKLTAIAANVAATRSKSPAYVKNTASVVVKCVFGNDTFIIAGDATCDTEAFMLKQYKTEELKVDILRVAHHGSASSSSNNFVTATNPDIAIISISTINRDQLPKKSVVTRFFPKLTTTDDHKIGYYSAGVQTECQTKVENAEGGYGIEVGPPDEVNTDKFLHETGFNGTFRVVLDGK